MKTKGFSLIEMLVYAALSIFFVVLVLQFFSVYKLTLCHQAKRAVFEASCNAGLDACARDCAAAPADARRWVALQPDYIAWKKEDKQEGFSLRNGTLVKIYKSVDANGYLKNPAYSTLVQHVQGAFSVNQSQGIITSIRISLTAHVDNQLYTLQRLVYLHEGLV